MERKILYYIEKVDNLINGVAEMPITVEIDPTNRCQLNCSFCMFKTIREGGDRKDLPLDLYQYLLLDLKQIGVKSITFTGGGEPTLHNEFKKFVKFADALGFEYGLITNGLRIDKIERPDKFKFIRVSIDAATAQTYQKIKRFYGFDRVCNNIVEVLNKGATVGLSFVVNEMNRDEIKLAQELAVKLGVAYIQFKPAWENGAPFIDYEVNGESQLTIDTQRYKAVDLVPCSIAGLIGIVGADSKIYYCCQKRGQQRYCLGDLNYTTFPNIWRRRVHLVPDIGRCANCRYMNYTQAYKRVVGEGTLFFKHKHFL